jgi:hypothetical protein
MSRIVFLVEERSMAVLLDGLLPDFSPTCRFYVSRMKASATLS